MANARSKVQKLKAKDYGFNPWQKMPNTQDKHFLKIHESMFKSAAWIGLTIHSQILYIEMNRKFTGYNDRNIMFLQKEGSKIMGKNTFTKSMKQLVAYGFIDYVERNSHNCLANIYGFSTRWHTFVPGLKQRNK